MMSTCGSCSDLCVKDKAVKPCHCPRPTPFLPMLIQACACARTHTHKCTQTAAACVNTKPSVVSRYLQGFALWPWIVKLMWLCTCICAFMCVCVCENVIGPWLASGEHNRFCGVCFGSDSPQLRSVNRWKTPCSETIIRKTAPLLTQMLV